MDLVCWILKRIFSKIFNTSNAMIPKTAAALKRFAVRKGSIGNGHAEEKCQ